MVIVEFLNLSIAYLYRPFLTMGSNPTKLVLVTNSSLFHFIYEYFIRLGDG